VKTRRDKKGARIIKSEGSADELFFGLTKGKREKEKRITARVRKNQGWAEEKQHGAFKKGTNAKKNQEGD